MNCSSWNYGEQFYFKLFKVLKLITEKKSVIFLSITYFELCVFEYVCDEFWTILISFVLVADYFGS